MKPPLSIGSSTVGMSHRRFPPVQLRVRQGCRQVHFQLPPTAVFSADFVMEGGGLVARCMVSVVRLLYSPMGFCMPALLGGHRTGSSNHCQPCTVQFDSTLPAKVAVVQPLQKPIGNTTKKPISQRKSNIKLTPYRI